MKFPAPDDWDEQADGYCLLIACIPNSAKWHALYRGQFRDPTWWKYYDKDGPPFNPAIQIAKSVYEGLCMANCDDILAQLTRIANALEAIGGDGQQAGGLVLELDQIRQHLDQLEEIQNNQTQIMGGSAVIVQPGGP